MNTTFEMMKGRGRDLFGQFMERYGQDLVLTDRLKMLLAAAVLTLVLSALLGLSAVVDQLETRHGRVQVELARLSEQIESSSWQERQQQSQVLKSVLVERLWTGQTTGLAEAGFERWLRERLTRNKMEPQQLQIRQVPALPQTESSDPQHPLAGVQQMTVKILMPFDQPGMLGFLSDISTAEKVMVVDRLIARTGRNARIELDVSTFYRPQGQSE